MDPAEVVPEKQRNASLQTAEQARQQNLLFNQLQEMQLEEKCKKVSQQNTVLYIQNYFCGLKDIQRQHKMQVENYIKERDEQLALEELRLQKQNEEVRRKIQQKEQDFIQLTQQKSLELSQLIEEAEQREIQQRNEIQGLVNDLHTLKTIYTEKHEIMKQLLIDLNSDDSLNASVEALQMALQPVEDLLEIVKTEAVMKDELEEAKKNIQTNMKYLDGVIEALQARKEERDREIERSNYEESQARLKAEQEKQAKAMQNEIQQASQAAQSAEVSEENRQATIITLGRRRYEELQKKMEDTINSQSTIDNDKKKEIGWIVTTINQLDSTNHSVNREKLQRLILYLSGRNVQHNRKNCSTNNHPVITAFVKFKLMKDMVKVALDTQGKETGGIAAYAWLIVSLIGVFPDLWEVFLYHIYTTCPYLVPLLIYQKEGQSLEDYDKERGKRSKEGFDLYLTRMGNAGLLFGLVLAKMHKKGGMPEEAPSFAWKFVAGMLMLDPSPGVSAEVLRQFLMGVGADLQQSYGKQFGKLMDYAMTVYWNQLLEITRVANEGESSKNQLQQLFEEFKKTRKLKPNEHLNKYN